MMIEQKYAKLRQYFDANHTLRDRNGVVDLPSAKSDSSDLRPEIAAAQQTIEEIRKDLPIPAFTHPPIANPAVLVEQIQTAGATDIFQNGEIVIDVIRDVFVVSGTGKLMPHMIAKPWVTVELVSAPPSVTSKPLKISIGVGTKFDFNVKVGSPEFGRPLALGKYSFKYVAKAKANTGNPVEATAAAPEIS